MLYVLGGADDIAQPNGLDDFQRITHVPVFVADRKSAGHFGVFIEPNGRGTEIEIDWLRWQLDGDAGQRPHSWAGTAGCAASPAGECTARRSSSVQQRVGRPGMVLVVRVGGALHRPGLRESSRFALAGGTQVLRPYSR